MISFNLIAPGATRGSVEYTPSTSVKISHTSAFIAPANATAVVSEPPRPNVVMSPASVIPWKPATTTMLPASKASSTRFGSISKIRALPNVSLVAIPACSPVIDTAA